MEDDEAVHPRTLASHTGRHQTLADTATASAPPMPHATRPEPDAAGCCRERQERGATTKTCIGNGDVSPFIRAVAAPSRHFAQSRIGSCGSQRGTPRSISGPFPCSQATSRRTATPHSPPMKREFESRGMILGSGNIRVRCRHAGCAAEASIRDIAARRTIRTIAGEDDRVPAPSITTAAGAHRLSAGREIHGIPPIPHQRTQGTHALPYRAVCACRARRRGHAGTRCLSCRTSPRPPVPP